MRRLACLLALAACRAPERVEGDVPAAISPAAIATPQRPAEPEAPTLHGELVQIHGQRVLRVWGTAREMGYAHGYLLRDDILEIVEDYALSVIPPATLGTMASGIAAVTDVPEHLREEAAGVIAGMQAAGGTRVEALDRSLSVDDLLLLNAMTDLLEIGCSAVAAWGEATEDDAQLGDAYVVRNLDWTDAPALLDNQLVVVYEPSDPHSQPFVSVTFAGFLGCLSCMNEAGVTALFNMGYGDGAADLSRALRGFSPANLMLRDAVQRRDADGDGRSGADDVEHVVRAATHAGSFIVTVLEPRSGATSPARVLEVEADGVVRRDPDDGLGLELLAATNHLRAKAQPRPEGRWRTIERTTRTRRGRFDRETLWDLGRRLRLPSVVHTMLVGADERVLGVWLRRPGEAAQTDTAPVLLTWDELVSSPR